jgi:hypothetical protein
LGKLLAVSSIDGGVGAGGGLSVDDDLDDDLTGINRLLHQRVLAVGTQLPPALAPKQNNRFVCASER